MKSQTRVGTTETPKADKISPMKQLFKAKVSELMSRGSDVEPATPNEKRNSANTNLVDTHIEKLQHKLKIY